MLTLQRSRHLATLLTLVSCLVVPAPKVTNSMELFQVKLMEQNNETRLIATSNYNYAMLHPKLLAKNWRTVSVNGDNVVLSPSSGGQLQRTTRAALGETEMVFLETLRDELANSNGAYSHVSSASGSGASGGGGNFMMSSNSNGMASSSSMSSSSSSTNYATGGQQTSNLFGSGGEMSYNMRDQDNFSVSRSDFPFNWSRVFINGELVTLVYRNGDVEMIPMNLLDPNQLEAVQRVRKEVVEMQQTQQRQISNTMQNSMDMVSNVFNNIMGNFPKPPSYQSAVGDMFGSNFPFGPNNSPFSASSGWPFGGSTAGGSSGGGAAAAAVAITGRR